MTEPKPAWEGDTTEETQHTVRDQAPPHDYRTEIPNLVDDMHLTPEEFRLYGHLKRVAGDIGASWQSTRTLADACNMSVGSVVDAKHVLTDHGLIVVNLEGGPGGQHHNITIVDIWQQNYDHYRQMRSLHERKRSPGERKSESVHSMNAMRSPGEPKKISLRRTKKKEDHGEEAGGANSAPQQPPLVVAPHRPIDHDPIPESESLLVLYTAYRAGLGQPEITVLPTGAARQALRNLLDRGIPAPDIRGYAAFLASLGRETDPTLMQIADGIDGWVQRGRPAKASGNGGHGHKSTRRGQWTHAELAVADAKAQSPLWSSLPVQIAETMQEAYPGVSDDDLLRGLNVWSEIYNLPQIEHMIADGESLPIGAEAL